MTEKPKSKRNLYIYIGIGITIFTIVFLVYKLGSKKTNNAYSFVPENAVLVWESLNTVSSIEKSIGSSIWNNLEQLPFYHNIIRRLKMVDSINNDGELLRYFFKDKPFKISLHITSSNEFDYIFYLPIRSKDEKNVFTKVINGYKSSKQHTVAERAFMNMPITTIANKETKETFSFIVFQNNIIGSMTPFLVEDVIRHLKDGNDASFYDTNKKNFEVARIKSDDGDMYISVNRFADFLKCFTTNENSDNLELLKRFSEVSFFDVTIQKDKIYLNGTSIPSAEGYPYFLDIFKDESSSSLELAPYIPMNTAIYYGFSFKDGISFKQKLKQFLKENNRGDILDEWYNLSVKENIYIEKLYELLGTHFAYLTLESINPAEPQHLFFINSNDVQSAEEYLIAISEKFSLINAENTGFLEDYKGYNIREMMKSDYLRFTFSHFFSGFKKCYFFRIDNYIVFANDIAAARQLIDDIKDEKVWGKSVRQNLFFEETVQKTNVNIIINSARSWSLIRKAANPEWGKFMDQYNEQLKRFEMIALQYEYLDDKFYTGAIIQHKDTKPKYVQKGNQIDTKFNFKTTETLRTKAMIIRSYVDNSFETLVQDSSKNLMLISKTGAVLWKKEIKGFVKEETLKSIDYFKNGKLQYCFSDDRSIYLIDRNGNNVEDFPVEICKSPNQYIEQFTIVDYNKNRDYRFVISDNKGQVFLTDKNCNQLEGWDPVKLDIALSAAPRHFRVQEKDILFFSQKNGKVDLKKRNAESYPGFPLEVYNRIATDYFVEIEKDFNSSKLYILDVEGLLKTISFSGKILSEIQFFKPDQKSSFELIHDGLGKSFVIARKDSNKLSLFKRNNKLLLEIDQIGNSDIQYYNFGADNEIFIVRDVEKKKVRIYKSGGKTLLPEALDGSEKLAVLYFDSYETFHLYKVFNNQLSHITFENQ